MGQPVAYDEIIDLEHEVIAAYLVEHLLVDGNVGGFVLDNHARPDIAVVQYGVATAFHAVELEGNFVGQQGGWIRFVLDEEMDEVLANPFLWRKYDIAAA